MMGHETVLVMGNKICFYGDIGLIILNYPYHLFLSGVLFSVIFVFIILVMMVSKRLS